MHKIESLPIENVIVDFNQAQTEDIYLTKKPADIMTIPGTAHQKLEILAEMAHK